ncbi:unnamed protein product [Absidia cylindrospora]
MLATRSILKTVAQTLETLLSECCCCSPGCETLQCVSISKAQSPDAEFEILREQRKFRPVSPHLQIYQPQITWYLSGLHRITGAALGGAFYLAAMGYLAAPALGFTVDTASAVTAVAAAPVAAKVLAKTTLAAPFVFHSLNGIRHLFWDATKFVDIKNVYKTGYAVLGGTVVGTLYLASL